MDTNQGAVTWFQRICLRVLYLPNNYCTDEILQRKFTCSVLVCFQIHVLWVALPVKKMTLSNMNWKNFYNRLVKRFLSFRHIVVWRDPGEKDELPAWQSKSYEGATSWRAEFCLVFFWMDTARRASLKTQSANEFVVCHSLLDFNGRHTVNFCFCLCEFAVFDYLEAMTPSFIAGWASDRIA